MFRKMRCLNLEKSVINCYKYFRTIVVGEGSFAFDDYIFDALRPELADRQQQFGPFLCKPSKFTFFQKADP